MLALLEDILRMVAFEGNVCSVTIMLFVLVMMIISRFRFLYPLNSVLSWARVAVQYNS